MSQYWSWALAAVGVYGVYLTGSGTVNVWKGFLVGVLAQALWITYAVFTQQWGFIASALAYGVVNAIGLKRNLRAYHERHGTVQPPQRESDYDI